MKKSIINVVPLSIMAIIGCSCSQDAPPGNEVIIETTAEMQIETEAESTKRDPAKEKVMAHFISDEEPTAKDASWTADDIFKIGVIDNGENRNGYAEYACQVLNDHGLNNQNIWVQIIDIEKVVNNQEFQKLGEAHCN
ncbi:MAG: hypothetical protein ACSHWN_04570 [Methylophilaceae bacterium]